MGMYGVRYQCSPGIGQMAFDQQMRDIPPSAYRRKLLDRVAAIVEQAFLAIDIGDAGTAIAGGEMNPGS